MVCSYERQSPASYYKDTVEDEDSVLRAFDALRYYRDEGKKGLLLELRALVDKTVLLTTPAPSQLQRTNARPKNTATNYQLRNLRELRAS